MAQSCCFGQAGQVVQGNVALTCQTVTFLVAVALCSDLRLDRHVKLVPFWRLWHPVVT